MWFVFVMSLACRKDPPPVVPAEVPSAVAQVAPAAPAAPEAPVSCLTDAECPQGWGCEGEGCGDDAPGLCVGMRPCTRDARPYCSCDGATFMSSGSCPGRRFAHRGPCP